MNQMKMWKINKMQCLLLIFLVKNMIKFIILNGYMYISTMYENYKEIISKSMQSKHKIKWKFSFFFLHEENFNI